MKAIQDSAAFFFVAAVATLSIVSVLGVWDFFAHNVINKSFETLGVLAAASVVVIVASRFIEAHQSQVPAAPYVPNEGFRFVRRGTLAILIFLAALLALIGVMSIWGLIPDTKVLWKSISSLAILAFGAFVIVATCMERERMPKLNADGTMAVDYGNMVGIVLAVLVGGWFIYVVANLFPNT